MTAASSHHRARRPAVGRFLPAVAIVAAQLVFFPAPAGIVVRGLIVGALSALVALGMALVYRANRVVSFAQADLGALPATLVVLLVVSSGLNYFFALTIGLVGAAVLGAVVELAIVRRFFRAPRLLLTVATLGIAQLLAAGAFLLPRLWGHRLFSARLEPPFSFSFTVEPIRFGASDLLAVIAVPIAVAGMALFLRATRVGIAVRASAEDADRASLLGIPVKRLHTLVWSMAAVLAFVATVLRAGIFGLPIGSGLTFALLLRSLAALVLGRMRDLPAVAAAAVALGVLELGVSWGEWRLIPTPPDAANPLLLDPILAVVIVAALVLRRRPVTRADQDETATWRAAEEVRPVPQELARLPVVRFTRIGVALALVVAACGLPAVLDTGQTLKAAAVFVFGVLGLSLVVLTGWAGQVSLGQVAFFHAGAVVGAIATKEWGLDLTLAVVAAAAVGAIAAVLVALPAARLRGFYLAVVSLAVALATSSYLLNPRFSDWVPTGRIERPPLLGRISIESPTAIYFVCLTALVAALGALHGIRRSRTGRALIALRENERGAVAYGIDPLRARLTAVGLSGALAAWAGAVFAHHQQAIDLSSYQPGQNLAVFVMVVIGGIASVPGALLGALYLRGTDWFLTGEWRVLATGAGVLAVLLVLPGGLGGMLTRLRDAWLRAVARRHQLDVVGLTRGGLPPSGLADPTPVPESPVLVGGRP